MDDIRERLDNHEGRIRDLEDTKVETLRALAQLDEKHEQRLREVKTDLLDRIKMMDAAARERDGLNSARLDRFETKMDGLNEKMDTTLDAVRKAPPVWVGPLIGILVAVGGWAVEIALRR